MKRTACTRHDTFTEAEKSAAEQSALQSGKEGVDWKVKIVACGGTRKSREGEYFEVRTLINKGEPAPEPKVP